MKAHSSEQSHWTPQDISNLEGKTALITGGNSGIGLETARVLSNHGARIILAGRDQTKLAAAAQALRDSRPQAEASTAVVDLGSLESIAKSGAKLAATESLDLLFNNAGVMNIPERRTTSDGFELTFGTNHLGHFALTAALLPALIRSPRARVVTVSALAARWRSGSLTDLMSERKYSGMGAYAKSKRANIVFTEELARRLSDTSIDAVVVHPGSAMTNLQRNGNGLATRLFTKAAERILMGSEEGAAWPSLYAGTAADIRNGGFYGPAGRIQTSGTPALAKLPAQSTDPAIAEWLWAESERLTGVSFP